MQILTIDSPLDWDRAIAHLPGAHLLQTWEWGMQKASLGWSAVGGVWRDESQPAGSGTIQAAALILERSLRIARVAVGVKVLYVPRGPLLDWRDGALRQRVLRDLQAYARRRGAVFIKIDPDVILGCGLPGSADERVDPLGEEVQRTLAQAGWRFSSEQIQFRNTFWIDLTLSEEELLRRMKQKTRYNLRVAERKGVLVREGGLEDLPLLYRMYAETSVRDGFVIREESYYRRLWASFLEAGLAQVWIAEVEGEAVGGMVTFRFGGRTWYFYGMSRPLHREKMPNYLLQWEVIRRAKAAGDTLYDLWGAPDEFNESDPMWGVYRFKEGLGGQLVRGLGAWDYPVRPLLYSFYLQALPRLLALMRRRGRARTQREVSP
jgi:lipid II:glycine glycyltransferase (peptidoglycan interpeptide bridge formation enzyme)